MIEPRVGFDPKILESNNPTKCNSFRDRQEAAAERRGNSMGKKTRFYSLLISRIGMQKIIMNVPILCLKENPSQSLLGHIIMRPATFNGRNLRV